MLVTDGSAGYQQVSAGSESSIYRALNRQSSGGGGEWSL